MIAPSQIPNPYVKPKWQAPVGVMESVVSYNCRKYGFPRPVLAMPMWEGAGNRAIDLSGYGNHGTLVNDSKWVADGIEFDGTGDRITIPQNQSIIGGNNDATYKYHITFSAPYLYYRTSEGYGSINYGPFNTGTWYHWCIVRTGDVITYYKDGIYIGYSTKGGEVLIDTVGAYSGGSNSLAGELNGVVLFNAALSAAQIKFLYENPYFMYRSPEELYGYTSAAPPTGNPFWYYNMLKRRN